MIAAGVLHDVIEKAAVDASELRSRFGARVAGLVLAVSDDGSIMGDGPRKVPFAGRWQAQVRRR